MLLIVSLTISACAEPPHPGSVDGPMPTAMVAPPAATARPRPGRPEPPWDLDINAAGHLSAGAYLDEALCLSALREIYLQPTRSAAPSYGFAPITVLGHCLRSRSAMLVRHILIVAVLAF